ncbi:MAG: CPBP family intramembrane metalloprotease [Clostridia bacterium]|nr:CPBP family intramembrane metalloprotease [Clostridia bacterium]
MTVNSILQQEKEYRNQTEKRARNKMSIALVACTLVFLAQILFSFIYAGVLYYNPNYAEGYISFLLDISMYVCYIGLPFLIAWLLFKNSKKDNKAFIVKRSAPKKVALFITGALGCSYIVNLIVFVLFPSINEFGEQLKPVAETPLEIFLCFCMYAILPAILEEWAFRGVLLKNLLPYGKWGAIIISAILFGFGHVHPKSIVNAITFGIILGICYEYTGSLKIPMIIHFINNAISTLALLVPEGSAIFYITSLSIYVFMGCGIAAIIYYKNNGYKHHKFTLLKPNVNGYKLSIARFMKNFVCNFAIIPYILVFALYFYMAFLLEL